MDETCGYHLCNFGIKNDLTMHFLSGLPRSGSTLLGTLLCQRPDVRVSATSGLIDIMGAAAAAWERSPQFRSGEVSIETLYPVLKGMIDSYYRDEKIVLDKSRGWPDPKIMNTMTKVLGQKPKIIATVRPIAECLASFMKIVKWDKSAREFVDTPLAAHLFSSYATLKAGYGFDPECFLFVDYDDLIVNPQLICDRVADFLNLPRFTHTFEGLSNPVPENDEKTWGIPNLHYVRPTIERAQYSARDVLGEKMWSFYQGGEFWNDKPDPSPVKGVLDFQLEAGLHGDFEKGWQLCELADENDNRALFNKGWYLMRQGHLNQGLAMLDKGREERIYGHAPRSAMPMWQGQKLNGETVVMQGECGFGDQIIHARFAKDIAQRGGRVVLACYPGLAPILSTIDGVSAVVQVEAIGGVYHNYYVPAMSSARILGYEYADLDGSPYIKWPSVKRKGGPCRVGICWRGDPKMMHDEYRQFDPEILFNLKGVELVSLQKGWDKEIPSHIKTPSLDTWEKTATIVANLDLVITSCTAVAHLSAAMGKQTWILVPVLSYYLWALPGNTSPWYNTVRLFRQTKYKDWTHAFQELKEAFREYSEKEMVAA